jgi:hypothetical protein
MSKSTFRIALLILCSAFVLIYALAHLRPLHSAENPVETSDADAEEIKSPKGELTQYSPIGFDYTKILPGQSNSEEQSES